MWLNRLALIEISIKKLTLFELACIVAVGETLTKLSPSSFIYTQKLGKQNYTKAYSNIYNIVFRKDFLML